MTDILEGVNVIDFTTTVAGPLVSAVLADYGATVIHVESETNIDVLRVTPPFKDNVPGINRSGYVANWERGKYGITLNFNHAKGIELAYKLITWADIMVENYTPGVLTKWKLNYTEVTKINPKIIMLSVSQCGQTGPRSGAKGYGTEGVGSSGFSELTGWPDRSPTQPFGAYTDYIAGPSGVLAILAALYHRNQTGEGQYLDLSMIECSLHFLAPVLLEYTVNQIEMTRMGNRDPYSAPHSVYPCSGEDKWCAISVSSDEEWDALCKNIGAPDLSNDPRFSTILARKDNEDELDRTISTYTKKFTDEQLMYMLQAAGVSAGAVQNSERVFNDPQLAYRKYFVAMNHPEIGTHYCDSMGFILSEGGGVPRRSAPCFGEHNHYVFTHIAGLSDEEFAELYNQGAFK